MKATNVVINGEDKPIFKDPATDSGTKKSAKGRVAVVKNSKLNTLVLTDELSQYQLDTLGDLNLLQTVWIDGRFTKTYYFDEIRKNVRN